MQAHLIDFAIVTALKIERDAVLSRLDEYKVIKEDFEPQVYYHGYVSIPGTTQRYTVVVTMLLDMGNDEAATATTRLLQRWQPVNLFMVGIAGGVRGRVDLGDVVVAKFVFYYQYSGHVKVSLALDLRKKISPTTTSGLEPQNLLKFCPEY